VQDGSIDLVPDYTEQTADKYGLKTLEDLGRICDRIALGMPPEAQERPQGLPGPKANYGCVPKEFVPFSDDGGTVTLKALLDDRIQAANIFSTSPVDSQARDVLNKVSRELTTENLMQVNEKVSGDAKQNPREAAAAWLKDKGLS